MSQTFTGSENAFNLVRYYLSLCLSVRNTKCILLHILSFSGGIRFKCLWENNFGTHNRGKIILWDVLGAKCWQWCAIGMATGARFYTRRDEHFQKDSSLWEGLTAEQEKSIRRKEWQSATYWYKPPVSHDTYTVHRWGGGRGCWNDRVILSLEKNEIEKRLDSLGCIFFLSLSKSVLFGNKLN